ncbi:MAG: hypothetical protein U0Y10_21910 [Spirosomataceae bacterium]
MSTIQCQFCLDEMPPQATVCKSCGRTQITPKDYEEYKEFSRNIAFVNGFYAAGVSTFFIHPNTGKDWLIITIGVVIGLAVLLILFNEQEQFTPDEFLKKVKVRKSWRFLKNLWMLAWFIYFATRLYVVL